MRATTLAFIFSFLFSFCVRAQKIDTISKISRPLAMHLAALLGYNLQKNSFAEVGVGLYKQGWIDYQPFLSSISVSAEISTGSKFILGPKIGSFFNVFSTPLGFGLNVIDYTNFENDSIRFRPEVGIGGNGIKIIYGYNIALSNNNFNNINKHNFSVIVMFP